MVCGTWQPGSHERTPAQRSPLLCRLGPCSFWLDPAANDFRGGCNLCPDNCASCAVSGAFGACDLCIDGFGPIGENGACAPCASDTCSECRRDDFTQDEYCNVCKFGFTAITPEPGERWRRRRRGWLGSGLCSSGVQVDGQRDGFAPGRCK